MKFSFSRRPPRKVNRVNPFRLSLIIISLLSLTVACTARQPAQSVATPDNAATETTTARNIVATWTAAPTATSLPPTTAPVAVQAAPTLAPEGAPAPTTASTTLSSVAPAAYTGDIDALIAQMTLDEKLGMLHGTGMFNTPPSCLSSAGYVIGVERLGIPGLCMADGPAGVRVSQPATALPAPVSLASSFNPELANLYGRVIAQEGRAYGQDVLLSPMVHNVRVPYAGRNFETFGEDPFLASRMAGSEVQAIQGAGLIATVKAYAANNQEDNRLGVDVNAGEQTLHEIELAGFQAAVDAGAGGVMCAYNQVNGTYSCENSALLTGILRTQWDYKGLVMTDWFASHPAGVNALAAGLDVEMPGEEAFGVQLKAAVLSDAIPVSAVDSAVRRILTSMDRVGLLDGSVGPRPSIDAIKDANAAVAAKAAEQGAVLLRNQNGTLPLNAADQAQLAVIGPTAKSPLIGGGGSAFVRPFSAVSTLDALTQMIGANGQVTFAAGIDLDGVLVPASALHLTQTYNGAAEINFAGNNTLPPTTGYYTFEGILTVPTGGLYDLKVHNINGFGALKVDGAQVVSIGGLFDGSLIPTADGMKNNSGSLNLTAGPHNFELTIGADPMFGWSRAINMRFAWVTPATRQAKLNEAVAAARAAKAVVVFGYVESTENLDRPNLALTGGQDDLISAITAANAHNVVVLNIPAPVTMPWIDQTGAILNMWYPGQEGGYATADLLLGKANPSGKLAMTFPKRETDLATAGHPEMYPGVNNKEYYSEGIYVGYRWFDKAEVEPLFPFGHGLSYTTFAYRDLMLKAEQGGTVRVSFIVQNEGKVAGAVVPQVYVGAAPDSPGYAQQAVRALRGFDRVELQPNESKRVEIVLDPRSFQYWDEQSHGWRFLGGARTIWVGDSSRDLRLSGVVTPMAQ